MQNWILYLGIGLSILLAICFIVAQFWENQTFQYVVLGLMVPTYTVLSYTLVQSTLRPSALKGVIITLLGLHIIQYAIQVLNPKLVGVQFWKDHFWINYIVPGLGLAYWLVVMNNRSYLYPIQYPIITGVDISHIRKRLYYNKYTDLEIVSVLNKTFYIQYDIFDSLAIYQYILEPESYKKRFDRLCEIHSTMLDYVSTYKDQTSDSHYDLMTKLSRIGPREDKKIPVIPSLLQVDEIDLGVDIILAPGAQGVPFPNTQGSELPSALLRKIKHLWDIVYQYRHNPKKITIKIHADLNLGSVSSIGADKIEKNLDQINLDIGRTRPELKKRFTLLSRDKKTEYESYTSDLKDLTIWMVKYTGNDYVQGMQFPMMDLIYALRSNRVTLIDPNGNILKYDDKPPKFQKELQKIVVMEYFNIFEAYPETKSYYLADFDITHQPGTRTPRKRGSGDSSGAGSAAASGTASGAGSADGSGAGIGASGVGSISPNLDELPDPDAGVSADTNKMRMTYPTEQGKGQEQEPDRALAFPEIDKIRMENATREQLEEDDLDIYLASN